MRPAKQPIRVAVDTGGTFTDCVWIERGRVHISKVLSTPGDPSRAILEALDRGRLRGPMVLLHGTTVGTNTLLQRKGARVALVTTAGLEDVIEIGRQARPKLYDFFFDRVPPLVPPGLRFGVEERSDAYGKVLKQPAAEDLQSLTHWIREQKPQAIAISLLFSFANPRNEQQVAGVLSSLDLPLSISHQILPEFREYERSSTVAMNAYLQPVMQQYLENLERSMNQRAAGKVRVFVMQSSGGITALSSAAREPVRTVLSGPAGGVVGAEAMARRSGFRKIISFDMGGTSTDVALVDGEIRAGTQTEVAGLPIGVPMLDIHTVGAGGGSVARFDAGGALRVGPESAGADPGPICYGRGTQPTVTDANLLLGRLQPDHFLGGEFRLDLERTRRMVGEWLRRQSIQLSLQQFAAGVIRVVNAAMEKAIRVVSIERGFDSREFTLVAFGGAGGLHACQLAQSLSIPRVLIPAMPGALSAFGILVSDVVKDYSRTTLLRCSGKIPAAQLDREFAAMRSRAQQEFRREGWRGPIVYRASVDLRYAGQGYELNIPFSSRLLDGFRKEHQRRYGYGYLGREIELVTVRLRAMVRTPRIPHLTATDGHAKSGAPITVWFDRKPDRAVLYDRDSLLPERSHRGPAVIAEYSATTLVPAGKRFYLDRVGNLVIEVSDPKRRTPRR